jgi:hypothetical protein
VSHAFLEDLFRAVAEALRSGRVGRPACVRGFLELSADHGHLVPLLARVLDEACRWLEDAPASLHAAGGAAAGQVTCLLRGESGATALLTAGLLRSGAPTVDLLILGSRGSLRHEGGPNAVSLPATAPWQETALSGEARAIRDALERALESGAPVEFRAGGRR